jgi:LysM repeat protein
MKRRLLIAGLALLAAPLHDAAAQNVSDLPTTQTQAPPPPGTQMPWYPGQPLPQQGRAAEAAPITVTKSGDKDKGRQGLILTDDTTPGEVSVAPGGPMPGPPPDTHTVQRGDTLWDLSSRYYKNPWGWPKLWSYNPQVTNPHWIYPGDTIRLLPPGSETGPGTTPAPSANAPRRALPPVRGPSGVFLRQTGFVEPGELKRAGKIVGSKEEKMLLGELDDAYVEFGKEKRFKVGEHYTIYHPTREVKHPITGKTLGHMVEILGEGEVRAVTDGKIATVFINDSINPIERGFLVGPLKRQFKVVPPRTGRADLQGVVVATLQPRDLIGAEHIVFVDRGKNDGVEIGNRFVVTRRGDGYQPLLAKGPVDDKRFPRESIAEILVVDLRDHVATGMVTSAVKEARVGDRVEARKGY